MYYILLNNHCHDYDSQKNFPLGILYEEYSNNSNFHKED